MSQRLIIGLEPNADWPALKSALLAAGAESVSEPSPAQPDALVVALPDGGDAQDYLSRARSLAGVRYAEADAWQSTF